MNAAVVIHRWFERGAGWAYAPEIENSKLAVMAVLDRQLKAGRPGTFSIQMAAGGCLIGTVADDPECPDPKAKGRKPTILRAVLLRDQPSEAQQQSLLRFMAEISPTRPGPDPALVLRLPANGEVPSKTAGMAAPKKMLRMRSNRKSTFTVIAVVIACAIGLAIVFGRANKPRSNSADINLEELAAVMNSQLSGWGVTRKLTTPDETTIAYFEFLSQDHVGQELLKSNHPYVEFIRRLPAGTIHRSEGLAKVDGVVKGLRALVSHLERRQSSEAGTATADECLRRIDQQMNYDAWRKRTRSPDGDLDRFAVIPNIGVVEYTERFRSGAMIDFAPIAELMKPPLQKWRIDVPDRPSPFRVFNAFFETLHRPRGIENCSASDRGHAYWEFVDRLPSDAKSLGWTCDDRDQLDVALRDLLQKLGGSPGGKTTEGLVEAIVREMDYDEWVMRPAVLSQKNGKPNSQELVQYVDRFRMQATRNAQ